MMKPPFKYYGSKIKLAKRLLPLLPPHRVYAEVCGGSGALLFAKSPSQVEIINDLDGEVVNFFRVLRDRGPELRDKLLLTPYGRDQFASDKFGYEDTGDPVERARRFFVLTRQSFNGCFAAGWSRGRRINAALPFHRAVDGIGWTMRRLRHVQIENQDAIELIKSLDGPDVLFYIDPPYYPDARVVKQRYRCEMPANYHAELLKVCVSAAGMIVLSGYSHPTYETALVGWDRSEFEVSNSAGSTNRGNPGAPLPKRTEVVWRNPQAIRALSAAAVPPQPCAS